MGRRKITIKQITDPKLRHITFNKRKNGLIKKAAELSMLCNVNMLLVFEDGAGNLVQFSKNKISNFNNFFQECTYHNVVELTAKEYPHFFKVNHYKKTKNKLGEMNGGAAGDQEDDDSDLNSGEVYNFNQSETKEDVPKPQLEQKSKEINARKATQPQTSFNPYMVQPKSEVLSQENSLAVPESRSAVEASNGANKKQKPKPTFPQNSTQQVEPANSKIQKIPNIDAAVKNPHNGNEMTEATFPAINPYRKDLYLEDQSKQLEGKGMDYNPTPFIPDQLKRLGSVPDAMNSPFPFYSQNNRLRPFNNFGLPFTTNEEALNSMLKGYGAFPFQIPTNVPLMNKPPTNGEMDEKFLETAKMLNLFNQPQNRQNLFTFQQDYQKMSANDPMRQVASGNPPDFHNQYFEENHEDPTAMYKSDSRFENGLPPANLNNRRYGGYEGYMNAYEEEYAGADKTKKFKHN